MFALTKPHGSCRGSGGSDMHKQIKNQNKDIKHPTAECRKSISVQKWCWLKKQQRHAQYNT